jgi:hypothetical protein
MYIWQKYSAPINKEKKNKNNASDYSGYIIKNSR